MSRRTNERVLTLCCLILFCAGLFLWNDKNQAVDELDRARVEIQEIRNIVDDLREQNALGLRAGY
jgi:hypothetical protein